METTSVNCTEITIRREGPKVALLEEFLHGTQSELGIIDSVKHPYMAEFHVKDFMLLHQKLLGLDANDIFLFEALRKQELEKLEELGFNLVP